MTDRLQTAPTAERPSGQSILSDYPALLSLDQLANLLARSPNGLRMALGGEAPYAARLNGAKLRIGRRVYFLRDQIERFLLDQNREEKSAADAQVDPS